MAKEMAAGDRRSIASATGGSWRWQSHAPSLASPTGARQRFAASRDSRARTDRARSKPREFAEVYDEHVGRIYGFFGYRVNSHEAAEDLTQQTFERALRAWGRFDPSRASPLTWLLAIARNLLIDYYRSTEAIGHQALAEIEDPASDPITDLGFGLDPDLERAVGRLSDRERELLALRYGADLTGREIAELSGLSLANVQQILSRSLRRLRAELEGDQGRGQRSGR